MSDAMLPYEPITCPQCGAQSWEDNYQCWLCREKSFSAPRAAAIPPSPEIAPAASMPVPRESARRLLSFSLATVMAYITAIAVGLGLTKLHFALGIVYGVFVMLPLIATTSASVRRRARGIADTRWQRVGRFLLNLVIFWGCIVSLVIAILVAFFVVCLVVQPDTQLHP